MATVGSRRNEWIGVGGRLLKLDAGGHSCDHTSGGSQLITGYRRSRLSGTSTRRRADLWRLLLESR